VLGCAAACALPGLGTCVRGDLTIILVVIDGQPQKNDKGNLTVLSRLCMTVLHAKQGYLPDNYSITKNQCHWQKMSSHKGFLVYIVDFEVLQGIFYTISAVFSLFLLKSHKNSK